MSDQLQAGLDWLNQQLAAPLPTLQPGATGEDLVSMRDALRRTRQMADLRSQLTNHLDAQQAWQAQALAAINKEEGR